MLDEHAEEETILAGREPAARQRYVRALRRFRQVLGERWGTGTEPWL